MTFDLRKPYKTRGGREAKVLGASPDGRLVGGVRYDDGTCVVSGWEPNGSLIPSITSTADLVNTPAEDMGPSALEGVAIVAGASGTLSRRFAKQYFARQEVDEQRPAGA